MEGGDKITEVGTVGYSALTALNLNSVFKYCKLNICTAKMNETKVLMMPLNCVKYACLRVLSDSYNGRIKNSVLKRKNTGKRKSAFWHIFYAVLWKNTPQEK